MKYKAIIFDMDGTIIDSEHIWNHATKSLIQKRGITLSKEVEKELHKKLSGLALPYSCKLIKEVACLPDSIESLIQEKSQIACELYKKQINFIEGFIEFHAKAKKYNLKLGLATNADNETLRIAQEKLNLEQLFGTHMYNISHVNNKSKPDPALYLHAAQKLEIDPSLCIAIEDSAHGVKAAKAAGIFCIGLNSSNNIEQIHESDTKVNSYHDINLEALLQINL